MSLVFKTARNSQRQINGGWRCEKYGVNREGCKYQNNLDNIDRNIYELKHKNE